MSTDPKTCARCGEREPGPGTILCVPCADALAARTEDR